MGPFVSTLSTERLDALAESRDLLAVHALECAYTRGLHRDRAHRWHEVARTHTLMGQEYRELANQRRAGGPVTG